METGTDTAARPTETAAGAGERRERRDAAEHRRRVLRAARELFERQGADATSMREIARAAGVGQGTLYRRFAHKGELCAALLGESARDLRAEIEERTGPASGLPVREQIEYVLRRLIRFNEENAPLLAVMGDAAFGPRRTSLYEGPLYGWLRAAVAEALRRGAERDELAPLDAEGAADAILAPLAIDLYLYQRQICGFTPKRIEMALRRVLLDGLFAR